MVHLGGLSTASSGVLPSDNAGGPGEASVGGTSQGLVGKMLQVDL